MPDSPEREIEKQLRASAEQRRAEAGAPFELHEATRRMLQAEVARQYSQPRDQPQDARSRWLILWPRLAMAAPLTVLLIVGIIWVSSPPATEERPLLASSVDKSPVNETESAQPALRPDASLSVSPGEREKAAPPATLALAPATELRKDQLVEADASRMKTPATSARDSVAERETPKPATSVPQPLAIASADGTVRAEGRPDLSATQPRAGGGFGGGGFGRGGGGGFGGGGARGLRGGRSGFDSRGVPGTESLADSTSASRSDGVDSFPARANTEPQALRREFTSAPTPAAAPTRGTEAILGRQSESSSTWYFRNSTQLANGVGFSRAAAGRGGRGGVRAPSSPAAPVLNSFQFEVTGSKARIVDEDGSVYLGQIQSSSDEPMKLKEAIASQDQLATRGRAAQEMNQAPMKQAPTMSQMMPVFFNVTGMNRSLSQQVTFTGQLQQAASSLATTSQTNAPQAAAGQLLKAEVTRSGSMPIQAGAATNLQLQQRIIGRARLSDSRELPVDAFQIQR